MNRCTHTPHQNTHPSQEQASIVGRVLRILTRFMDSLPRGNVNGNREVRDDTGDPIGPNLFSEWFLGTRIRSTMWIGWSFVYGRC